MSYNLRSKGSPSIPRIYSIKLSDSQGNCRYTSPLKCQDKENIAKLSMFERTALLLRPGDGQLQNAEKHKMGTRRGWGDPQVWTHICFVAATVVAAKNGLYDLFLLLIAVIPLSTAYHITYEKPGALAQMEGTLAKLLFLYGTIQLFFAPTTSGVLASEILMLVATLIVFIGTNLFKQFYDPWHSLMHVVPAIWALIVACYHAPLVKIPGLQ